MKKARHYKNMLLLLALCLIMSSVFYSVHNIASISSFGSQFMKAVQIRDNASESSMADTQRVILRGYQMESFDGQLISDIDLDILWINIKNTLTLFSRLTLPLVIFCYFLKWINSDPYIRVPSFIMHFLQLKDGKKDAASYLFLI